MVVDGNQLDPRMKFAVSVNGMRGSHDGSPIKTHTYQNAALPSSVGDTTVATVGASDTQTVSGSATTEAQAVKIPVICGFHKRVLLLTS
jgi:hypothetical protein